jgi:hypothetical protein
MSKHYNPEPPSGPPKVPAPLPPSTPMIPLGTRIEKAIRDAASLGKEAFDVIEGRGLYHDRLGIQKLVNPGMVGERAMPLKEFIGTLPKGHIARNEYEMLIEIFETASRFCSELQEDADGVPQEELKKLHSALDAWEERE